MNLSWSRERLIQAGSGYWLPATLHAAAELELFDVLRDAALTAAEVAEQCQADPRATAMLLDALAAAELLMKSGQRYVNSTATREHLCRDRDGYLGDILRHHQLLVPSWNRLAEAVRRGQPVRTRAGQEEPARREAFLRGMHNLASALAPQLAASLDLSRCSRMLDLGGGPGTYSVHFCLAHPQLHATLFDLPTTAPVAAENIHRFGLEGRIRFVAGDFTRDALPQGFDLAWLSHILHGESPESAQLVLNRAAAALTSGGRLVVHEFILDDDRAAPLFPALFSLNMLLGSNGGQAYSEGELRSMLDRAGLRNIRRLPLPAPGPSGLLTGER